MFDTVFRPMPGRCLFPPPRQPSERQKFFGPLLAGNVTPCFLHFLFWARRSNDVHATSRRILVGRLKCLKSPNGYLVVTIIRITKLTKTLIPLKDRPKQLVEITNLHNIQQVNFFNGWELNLMRGIHDALKFDNMIANMLKWSPSIHHHVKNTSKWPHIAGPTNLPEKKTYVNRHQPTKRSNHKSG